jgi:hypothetical protein
MNYDATLYFVLCMQALILIILFFTLGFTERVEKQLSELRGREEEKSKLTEEEIYKCWLSLRRLREQPVDEEKQLLAEGIRSNYGALHACGNGSIPRSPGA